MSTSNLKQDRGARKRRPVSPHAMEATRGVDGLLTVEQLLATRLPVSRRTLQDLVRTRAIGFLRCGRRLYFRPSDVDTYLDSLHVDAAPAKGGSI